MPGHTSQPAPAYRHIWLEPDCRRDQRFFEHRQNARSSRQSISSTGMPASNELPLLMDDDRQTLPGLLRASPSTVAGNSPPFPRRMPSWPGSWPLLTAARPHRSAPCMIRPPSRCGQTKSCRLRCHPDRLLPPSSTACLMVPFLPSPRPWRKTIRVCFPGRPGRSPGDDARTEGRENPPGLHICFL